MTSESNLWFPIILTKVNFGLNDNLNLFSKLKQIGAPEISQNIIM